MGVAAGAGEGFFVHKPTLQVGVRGLLGSVCLARLICSGIMILCAKTRELCVF